MFLLPGGRPRGLGWPGNIFAYELVMLVVAAVVVVDVAIVGVGVTDFAAGVVDVDSIDVLNDVFGEPNIAGFKPGNEILCGLIGDPAAIHSSNDNRFAFGFLRAFNS